MPLSKVAAVAASLIAAFAAGADELSMTDSEIGTERDRLAAAGFALWIDRQLRLTRIDAKLRTANAALCKSNDVDIVAITGIVALAASDLPKSFRSIAYEQLGVDDFPTVLAVAPDQSGDAAGVRAGDAILHVNDVETHSTRSLEVRAAPDETLTLQIAREGRVYDLQLTGTLGCPRPAELLALDTIDLYSEDDRVVVCAGLLRFVASDDELAILLGHELAHALLDPSSSEIDVDRLGLEITARAGFAVSGAAALSRRIEREFPFGFADRTGYAHPVSIERWNAMEKVVNAIERDRNPP